MVHLWQLAFAPLAECAPSQAIAGGDASTSASASATASAPATAAHRAVLELVHSLPLDLYAL